MQQYKYTAINLQNEKITGNFIAADEQDLAVQLSKQGLYLLSATPYSGKSPSAFFTTGTGKVKLSELTAFCRQYSIMLNAGISLLNGIEILKEQNFSHYFRSLLQVVYEDVKTGVMLSEAMAKHKRVFPEFFRSMIKVGELGGRLDLVMNSLADYYERDSAIKKKVKSAFAYPIMLCVLAFGIIVIMLAFVIPTFRKTLAELNIEATGLTKAVYSISDFLINHWAFLLLGAFLFVGLILLLKRTKKGRYFFDWLKMHAPFVRKPYRQLIAARFARGFGLLLSSGMDMTEALNSVVIVFGNKYVEEHFKLAVEDICHGVSLAVAFDRQKLFPDIMLQMIAVGERTASLDEVLTRSCNFFDDAVETSLTRVTTRIQPVMLGVLGIVVVILFLAVYSPMLSIMTQLNV